MCCGIVIKVNDCLIRVIESDGTEFNFNHIVEVGEKFVVLKNDLKIRRIVSSEILSPKGNLKLFFEDFIKNCENCCGKVDEYITEDLSIVDNNLPATFTECTSSVFIDVDLTQDIDISSWIPVGLCSGAIVRLRKTSKNGHTIKWNDYTFLNKKGELITFIWNGTEFKIV